jgi:tetratricopeptide (TPR) repeat protein
MLDAMSGRVPYLAAFTLGARAMTLFLLGDDAEAQAAIDEWEESCPRRELSGAWWFAAVMSADEALARFASEDTAREIYEQLVEWRSLRGPVDRWRGRFALRFGLDDAAAEHFHAGLDWCEREGAPIEAGRCLQGLAEVAERRGDHALAMEQLDRAGALFSQYGAKLYLDQVLAKKQILKA